MEGLPFDKGLPAVKTVGDSFDDDDDERRCEDDAKVEWEREEEEVAMTRSLLREISLTVTSAASFALCNSCLRASSSSVKLLSPLLLLLLALAFTVADEEASMETPSLSRVEAGMANGTCRVDSLCLADDDDAPAPPLPVLLPLLADPALFVALLPVARRVQEADDDGPDEASEGRAALPLVRVDDPPFPEARRLLLPVVELLPLIVYYILPATSVMTVVSCSLLHPAVLSLVSWCFPLPSNSQSSASSGKSSVKVSPFTA